MAILIKGMEMPDCCDDCIISEVVVSVSVGAVSVCNACDAFPLTEEHCTEHRPSWCPLVEVKEPKRGDTELLEASNFEL